MPDPIATFISEARARCEAATPGPWELERGNAGADHPLFLVMGYADGIRLGTDENTAFAAHARTDLPLALDALEVAMVYISHEIAIQSHKPISEPSLVFSKIASILAGKGETE